MPRRQNVAHAADPAVPLGSNDPRHSPDAGEAGFTAIPLAPATLAEMKNLDPEGSIGTASDYAGVTAEANRRTVRNRP